jgi:uncharacterized protein (DUF4415 family)
VTDKDMKRLSLDDVRALKNAGKLHIDPNLSEVDLPEEFWQHAKRVERENKKSVHLRLEPEVFRFFQEEGEGKGHIKRMQDVLAAYVRAKKTKSNPAS